MVINRNSLMAPTKAQLINEIEKLKEMIMQKGQEIQN
jgi:hypothetical protein